RRCDLGGSGPVVRGARCAAPDALLGLDGRLRPQSAARGDVDLAVPRRGDRAHGARRQPPRGRPSRRPRSARAMTDVLTHPAKVRALREELKSLRATEFPWTAETIYLNNASIGPIPERTRRALDEFNAK